MGLLATLYVRLGLDKKGFDQGADNSKKKLKEVGTEAEKMGNKTDEAGAKGSKALGPAMLLGAIVAAGVAIKKLWAGAMDLYNSFGQQERATNSLAEALRNNGKYTDDLLRQYSDFATEMQKLTNTGDELVMELLKIAETMQAVDPREAVRGAIALSKAFGIDVKTGIRMATLAMDGNFTMLSRYVPAIRSATTEADKLAAYQKAVADGFNLATTEAKDSLGVTQRVSNSWGDLKEVFGEVIAVDMKGFFQGLAGWLEEINTILSTKSIPAWERWLAAITGVNAEYIRQVASAEKKNREIFDGRVQRMAEEMAAQENLTGVTEEQLAQRVKAAEDEATLQAQLLNIRGAQEKKSFLEKLTTNDAGRLLLEEGVKAAEKSAKAVTEADRIKTQATLVFLQNETAARKKAADAKLEIETAASEKTQALLDSERQALQDLIDGLAAYTVGSENYYSQLIAINDKRIKNLSSGAIKDALKAENEELRWQLYLIGQTAEQAADMTRNLQGGEKLTPTQGAGKVTDGMMPRPLPELQMSEGLKKQQQEIKDTYEKMVADAERFSVDIGAALQGGAISGFQALAKSIGETGKVDVGAVVGAILGPLGDMAISTGVLAIAIGTGIEGIKASLKTLSPYAAIAAGVALVALGVAAKAGAAAIASGKSGGGGGAQGMSVSGASYASNAQMGTQRLEVVGVIKGSDIWLANNKETQRRAR